MRVMKIVLQNDSLLLVKIQAEPADLVIIFQHQHMKIMKWKRCLNSWIVSLRQRRAILIL